ncbi:MAG: LysR substrate-binding domain-containing protein [Paracoccaceae bacterium]
MIMHPAIKLRHIRAFLDIAREGSLTAVATAQGISQPALSRTLAELEALLSQPLFRREGRRLVLTEQGALFRHHASLGVQALEAAAGSLRGNGRGRLQIGVLPTVAARLIPVVALRLRAALAETVISVATGPHPYLIRLLRDGAIDVMVGRMPVAAEMADLAFEHLYEEDIVLCARAGHPLRGQPLTVALQSCPLILPPEGAVIRRAVDDYLASLGLGALQAAFETVALPIGRGLVSGSDALWFISRGVIQDALERGEMVLLPTPARFLSGAVGLTRRARSAPDRGVELLVQLTRDCVAQGLHR